jgi:hypothetical protein
MLSEITLETLLRLMTTYPSQFQTFLQQFQNEEIVESAPYLVETSSQKKVSFPSPEVQSQGIINQSQDSEGGHMDKERRDMLQQSVRLAGASLFIPAIGHQDLITQVQQVLHQPSSSPGDKELKYLEQKIRYYWLDYYGVTIAPTDLVLHVNEYVLEVMILLKHSLLPSIRTRLCACLSQAMLLIGVNFYAAGQFPTARKYFQTSLEAAHEANNNALQAEAWYWDSFSWMRSDETGWEEHAQGSMLKACYFGSLQSDLAVQGVTLAGSAEAYAHLKKKDLCIQALKDASGLGQYGRGDFYHIHQFDDSHLNGYRGLCLQHFYQANVPETRALLEDARQSIEEALSQPNAVSLQRIFYVADMAQLQAREGDVESACNSASEVIGVADSSASVRHKLLTVRTLLEPYADVQVVKDLESEMRALVLVG